ncbi:MAG: hypothetical protein GWO24_17545, partial [Akkermansiaceae bacterium]|nr:hypothetical protein [Akkermansiaceae bacterium]
MTGLADRDPGLATDLVLRLAKEGNERASNLIEVVANKTLQSGSPEEAAIWSETLPDGPIKGAAMGRIADVYAARDPEAAAQWAEQF